MGQTEGKIGYKGILAPGGASNIPDKCGLFPDVREKSKHIVGFTR